VRPARLKRRQIDAHLAGESADVRRLALRLRRMILSRVPRAAEAIRFNSLCYYHDGVPFGAIGGNICMIEVRPTRQQPRVLLSFIQGASVKDPHGLLRGKGKAKRFVPIPSLVAADDPRIDALVRAAAEVKAATP
jgi:hypothetical protein